MSRRIGTRTWLLLVVSLVALYSVSQPMSSAAEHKTPGKVGKIDLQSSKEIAEFLLTARASSSAGGREGKGSLSTKLFNDPRVQAQLMTGATIQRIIETGRENDMIQTGQDLMKIKAKDKFNVTLEVRYGKSADHILEKVTANIFVDTKE